MPPKHKKQSATPRDRRHENGLAPPAKQVKKQKSDGHINGHAALPTPTSNIPAASSQLSDSSPFISDGPATNGESASSNMASNHTSIFATLEHRSTGAVGSDVPGPPIGLGSTESPGLGVSSHTDSIDTTIGKGTAASALDTATTVIAPLAPVDVIAILLVLMQLPYSVLAIIYVCFTILTFGSPPAGWSLASIFSATDWLQSHGGSPSIVTMIFVDLVFFGLWCLLPLGKDFSLDLAQAVVAISLGGGTSGGTGRTQGVLCFGIVAIHHMLGQKLWNTRHYTVAWFCSILNMATTNTSFGPWDPDDILDALDVCPDSDRSWPRTLLELHIVTQGIVRIIRRWFIRPSMQKFAARRGDSDPAYIPPSSPAAPVSVPYQDGGRNPSSDGRHPGPSPAGREGGREKSVSVVKKKRKQATFVRSQQPFWAAIANTKITVSKEIEQSQASQDSFEAAASSVEQLGSSINRCANCCVWITDVQDTEIRFKALCLHDALQPDADNPFPGPNNVNNHSSIVVLINGAEWASTTIVPDGSRDGDTLLKGKIFGLTSLTNYMVQFVKGKDRTIVQSIKLVTRPDTTIDQAPPEGPFRPSSPTSTLKKSIGAAESTLTEHRNRSKKNKRDHRSSVNALKKDIDFVESRLLTCGGNDERQKQRQIQYRQNIKQAEESYSTLAEEIESLGEIPKQERQTAVESKDKWSATKKAHNTLRGELDTTKANVARQLAAARTETNQLQQKQDRLNTRLNKLNVQRDGLLAANEQDHEDQKRRDQTRMNELARTANEQRQLTVQIRSLENQRLTLAEQSSRMEQQLQYLEAIQTAPMTGDAGVMQTPEGSYSSLAHTGNRPAPGFGSNVPPFQQPIGTPPVHSRRDSLLKQNRVRSSSMLSNVSGFTEDEIGVNAPPNGVHGPAVGGHATREGSVGSSGGSQRPGSGSRPDTNSPAPPKPGPIGAERDRNSPRNTRG